MTLKNTDIRSEKTEVFRRNINDIRDIIWNNVVVYIRDRVLIYIVDKVRMIIFTRIAHEVIFKLDLR